MIFQKMKIHVATQVPIFGVDYQTLDYFSVQLKSCLVNVNMIMGFFSPFRNGRDLLWTNLPGFTLDLKIFGQFLQ